MLKTHCAKRETAHQYSYPFNVKGDYQSLAQVISPALQGLKTGINEGEKIRQKKFKFKLNAHVLIYRERDSHTCQLNHAVPRDADKRVKTRSMIWMNFIHTYKCQKGKVRLQW